MTTPNGTQILAHLPDGSSVNVTAGVQALYDLVISSMDWGSGFWTVDDAEPVVLIAQTCGFAGFEEAVSYVEKQRQSEEQRAFLILRKQEMRTYNLPRKHGHVFSTLGKCMWPNCKADSIVEGE